MPNDKTLRIAADADKPRIACSHHVHQHVRATDHHGNNKAS